MLSQFDEYVPPDFGKYIEPFVGGGAVFFHLFAENRIKKAILLDLNRELIDCYIAIRDNLDELIAYLYQHKGMHSELKEKYYYNVRDEIRNDIDLWNSLSVAEKASITIYLNKTCYNGLYRVNRRNQFNVPAGKYKDPKIYDLDNLKSVSQALKTAKVIKACDFSECLKYAEKDDFVYLDPPYNPLSKTSSFTGYTKGGFGENEQIRLSEVYKELEKKGCKVMLSNSDTDFIKELYRDFRIEFVRAIRAINSKASGRGKVNELIILNYAGISERLF